MNGKAKSKLFGAAIIGMRVFIKALELEEGQNQLKSQGWYRYQIDESRTTAFIYDTRVDGKVEKIVEMTIEEWAEHGKEMRLALIGLKATKAELEEKEEEEHVTVLFKLNVISGEAHLSNNGIVVAGLPTNIEDWADIGAAVEERMFRMLREADRSGSESNVWAIKAIMQELGILLSREQSDVRTADVTASVSARADRNIEIIYARPR